MTPQLLRSDSGGIATLTLNRPDHRNALTVTLLEDLVIELTSIQDSGQVRAVILTGAGGAFCSGADLTEFAGRPADPGRQRRIDLVAESMARLRGLPGPTIAAACGPVLGAGWGLALACDLTYAAAGTIFCLPEVPKGYRLPPAITSRLREVVGPVRAAEIILTGSRYTGTDGVAAGWVARCLPDTAAVLRSAAEVAQALAAQPPEAITGVVRALRACRPAGPYPRFPTEQNEENGEHEDE